MDPKLQEPELGMQFKNIEEVKECIRNYAVCNGLQIKFKQNEARFLEANCAKGCNWKCYASYINGVETVQVKTYKKEHNCNRQFKIKLGNAKWLARRYNDKLIESPKWKLADFVVDVRKTYGIDVSKSQYLRAKRFATGEVDKSLIEHYNKVRDYAGEVLRRNVGSTVKIELHWPTEGQPPAYFQRMYIGFSSLIKAWKQGCRAVFGLDGCFLKGHVRGQILTDVGRDGNNQMFPIAWAVVEGENTNSWLWFLELFAKDIGSSYGIGLTILSDQQKGLVHAIATVLPLAEHRCCARHVYANFKKRHSGALFKSYFWQACKSGTPEEFENVMDKIKAMSEDAYNYLMKQQNPKQWCRAYFLNHSTCEAVENNMCETFNNCIIEARGKPLIYMLEDIRLYVMKRMQQRKALVNGWGDKFAPKIRERIEIAKVNSRFWICHYNGDNRFEVRHINGIDAYVVDTKVRTCACKEWDLTGIPCCHAVTTIIYNSTNPDDYVHSCYYVETIKKAYAYSMNPLNGPNLWRNTNIEGMEKFLPPLDRRMPGRPKKNRRKDPHESPSKPSHLSRKGTQMHCTNCKGVGHNKKGCTNAHVPPTTHKKQAKNAPSNASNATVSNNASNATVSNNASNAPKRKNPPKGFGIFQCPVTGDTFVKSAGQKRGKWLKNTPSSQRSCTGSNGTSVTPRT